jgi:hypothetical protein
MMVLFIAALPKIRFFEKIGFFRASGTPKKSDFLKNRIFQGKRHSQKLVPDGVCNPVRDVSGQPQGIAPTIDVRKI